MMKTTYTLAMGVALCLLLSSCDVTSESPLSSPASAKPDQALLGDWFAKKDQDTYHFTAAKGGWMHVVIKHKASDTKNKSGMLNRSPDEYDFFPTVIGKNSFLNIRMKGSDDEGNPKKFYILVRYSISTDHRLHHWMMSQDVVARTVRSGKLKGAVHQDKDPMMVGNPPHPDVDVDLQEPSGKLVSFIESTNIDELFGQEAEPLTQIK
jgi:hypothetical protein